MSVNDIILKDVNKIIRDINDNYFKPELKIDDIFKIKEIKLYLMQTS